jgi:pimeloyl-ACP methyl ester carboxylesterase
MRQTFKNVVAEGLESYMKNVSVPVLLAWGAEDRITPIWIARRMKEVIKGATLSIIPDTDHGVSYKHPDLFVSAIQPFLTTV